MEKITTVEMVAKRLQVHKNTIYRWIKSGRLKAYRLGGSDYGRLRVEEREVERLLLETTCPPA